MILCYNILEIMKIAFIGQKGIPMTFGGVEKHVERLAVGLSSKGHDVYAYTRPWYTPAKKKQFQKVKLISLRSIKTKNLDAITHTWRASWNVVFKQNFDVIHYHGVGPSLLAWIPRLFKPSVKVVVTFHCQDRYHQKWGRLARWALQLGEWSAVRYAHDTITVSKVLQIYCNEHYNASTLYVPNGIDLPKQTGAQEIKKLGLNKDSYIFFISRLVKHKGVHYLIDAYKKIKTKKKLVIAGGSAFTDNYVKRLKKMANGDPNIIFTGNVKGGSQLWSELHSNAYMMVHPSESEGLPIVILEAMSFGLPVLASDIPEDMEAINGGFGFSFKNTQVRDLREKMEYLLGCPKLVKAVGQDARKHVEKNYNWKDIVNSIEKVYEDVLEGHEHHRSKAKKVNCVNC